MIDITRHTEIADTAARQEAERKLLIEKEEQERLNYQLQKEFDLAVLSLDHRLLNAAQEGKRRLVVAHFSAWTGSINPELHKKKEGYGNYYCAWNKAVFVSDVIANMQGSLKMVYDYLVSLSLNPKIEYWTDGGGQDEGFQLVIVW